MDMNSRALHWVRNDFALFISVAGWMASCGLAGAQSAGFADSMRVESYSVVTQNPSFGDSTWVAPYPYPVAVLEGDPSARGPRVAEPDRTQIGETVLRFPFRVVGAPFRLLATGVGLAGGVVLFPYVAAKPIVPIVDYGQTSGLTVGLGVRSPKSDSTGWTGSLSASLSLKDHRWLGLEQGIGRRRAPLLRIESEYRFRPNRPFYGIGNSSKSQRFIYLEEGGLLDASLLVGSNPLRQARLIGGYSNVSARRGYDGVPSIEERFDPSEVPFFLESSRVISYGAGADLALLNDPTFPSLGIHGRGEVRRVRGLGDTDVEYMQWHLEGRGYLPVFADRRVIAVRVVHQAVDPVRGRVPHYRLPASASEVQFSAFPTERFRDQQLLLAQVEYRWEIWDFASAYAFTQWGAVASSAEQFRLADGHESHGGGFRFDMLGLGTARLEFARGPEGTRLRFKGGDF